MRNTIIISIFALLGFMACQEEIQQVPMAQAVTGLEVSDSTSNAVTLKWTMGENTEYVLVSYSRAGEQETSLEEKITKETYTVEGLTYVKDSPYEFTVVSYNSDDIAGGSAKVESNVVMPARDIPAVTFLNATNVSQTTATFKWGQPKGIAYVQVEWKREGDYPLGGSQRVDDKVFKLSGVQPDDANPVKVTVTSYDEDGYQGASSSIEVICGGTKNIGVSHTLYQVDALKKVLRGQFSDGSYEEPSMIHVAQGETASVQVVVLPKSTSLTDVKVSIKTFENESGAKLPEPKGGWVEFVESIYNGEYVSTNLNGGYMYPDVIIPSDSRNISESEFGTYWYDVFVPSGTSPGTYESVFTLSGSSDGEPFSTDLIVRMEVWPVVLEESDLLVTNWLFEDRYRHVNNGVDCSRTNDPETFYKIHKLFANTCRDLGQNTYRMDHPMNAMYPRGIDENGKYKFDFSAFDENVEFLIKEGGLKCIEGSHLCTAAGYGGDYGLNMFYWYNEEKGAFERMGTWSDFEDPEVWAKAEKHITDFFQALQEHLREKGWLDMYVQHIGDEPTEQPDKGLKNWPSWVKFAAAVKKAAPEIKLMDAVDAGCADKISPYIDIMCPVLHVRLDDQYAGMFEERYASGKRDWIYTCMFPQGGFANRFVVQPLLMPRYIHWLNYKLKANGYLHWGLHWWPSDILTRENGILGDCSTPGSYFPGGDPYVIYPGYHELYLSNRACAMRDGINDYALLKMAEKKNKAKTDEIVDRMIQGPNTYELDVKKFREARVELLEILK